jgi:hypothetical protein
VAKITANLSGDVRGSKRFDSEFCILPAWREHQHGACAILNALHAE